MPARIPCHCRAGTKFQITVTTKPASSPATAPARVARGHRKVAHRSGKNCAMKPYERRSSATRDMWPPMASAYARAPMRMTSIWMSLRSVSPARSGRNSGRHRSLIVTEAAACRSASPVDMEAARAPAQNRPTTTGGSPIEVTTVGRILSAGFTPGKARMPEKPMNRIGTRNIWKVGYHTIVRLSVRSLRAV